MTWHRPDVLSLLLEASRPKPWEESMGLEVNAFVVRPRRPGVWCAQELDQGKLVLVGTVEEPGAPMAVFGQFRFGSQDVRELGILPAHKLVDALEHYSPRLGFRFHKKVPHLVPGRWSCTGFPRTRSEALGCLVLHDSVIPGGLPDGAILEHATSSWAYELPWDAAVQ